MNEQKNPPLISANYLQIMHTWTIECTPPTEYPQIPLYYEIKQLKCMWKLIWALHVLEQAYTAMYPRAPYLFPSLCPLNLING